MRISIMSRCDRRGELNHMLKLLIVDDEARTRKGLATLILQNHFPVEIIGIASNGIEALEIAKATVPDIVITDVRMPKMDGIKFATEAKSLNPDIQIIFISGYSDKQYLKSAISLNAIGYVEKPIIDQELFGVLSSAIGIAKSNKQRIEILKQNQSLHEQQQDTFLEKIAIALTNSNIDREKLERLQLLYPKFSACFHHRSVICRLSNKSHSDNEANAVFQKIKKISAHCSECFLSARKSNCDFIIHIGYNHTSQLNFIRNTLSQIFSELKTALSGTTQIFFAVGSPVDKTEQLFRSYSHAAICLEKLFFTGYNNICYYSDGDDCRDTAEKIDKSVFRAFNSALKNDNCDEAVLIATRLFNEYKKPIYLHRVNDIKNAYYQLSVILDIICSERNFPSIFAHDAYSILEHITQFETIAELHSYLSEKLKLYSEELVNNGLMSKCAYRIQHYIELHFQEPDLSVNKLAASLNFTSAYLCQVFKKEKGTTINAYINAFRIGKATELLKNPDVKLFEVSYLVGYSNSNYFSRQFKKHIGMTPTEFRKKNIP